MLHDRSGHHEQTKKWCITKRPGPIRSEGKEELNRIRPTQTHILIKYIHRFAPSDPLDDKEKEVAANACMGFISLLLQGCSTMP